MTADAAAAIPQRLVERFAQAYADFVGAVRAAVADAARNPATGGSPAVLSWQTRALPLLERQNEEIQTAMARYLIGETQTIVTLASGRRGLAKELDGLPLDIAGPDRAKALDALETAVVVAAYHICQAAGIP